MGNASSSSDTAEDAAISRVIQLKDELRDMERELSILHHQQPRVDVALLPHQVRLHGIALDSDPNVRVLVGPVVGAVHAQCARILLEVDRTAIITCHIFTVDELSNHHMTRVPQSTIQLSFSARQPAVFVISSLLPGRRYHYAFSGIHRDDMIARIGSFVTPTQVTSARPVLHCAIVSGDAVQELEHGERSLWHELRALDVPLVLHLGGQVVMQRLVDQAWTLLMQHAEYAQPPTTILQSQNNSESIDTAFTTAWNALEAQAMEILRSGYRTQWTLNPDKQYVLANTSNLMLWSAWDIYPAFSTSESTAIDYANVTLEMQVTRTVLRCVRRLYHEYQRALHDDESISFMRQEQEIQLLSEKSLATTAKLTHLHRHLLPAAAADLESQKKKREIEGARLAERHLKALESEKARVEKQRVSYRQQLVPSQGEAFVHMVGSTIMMLFIDARSCRLEPGGGGNIMRNGGEASDLISTAQWAFIEQQLERDEIQTLVICTEAPLVEEQHQELKKRSSICQEDMLTWWGCNPLAQQRLLGLLFAWKLAQPNREVILFAGASSTRHSMRTTIKDTRLRSEMVQWTVGPITARLSVAMIPRQLTEEKQMLFDRYSYQHTDVETVNQSFAVLRVSIADAGGGNTKKRADLNTLIVRQGANAIDALPCVLVGPVIGMVDATRAVILLEVDRDAIVVCVLSDPITNHLVRSFQQFHANKGPRSFVFTHLKPEHYYEVSFERVYEPMLYRGSFTTLSLDPKQFDMIALTARNERMSTSSLLPLAPSLWPSLVEQQRGGVPFSGVDLMVLFSTNEEDDDEAENLVDVESDNDAATIERLRAEWRLEWNMPGMRHTLSHNSHLLVPSNTSSTNKHTRLSERVRLEYENHLMLPSMRVEKYSERCQHPLSHIYGSMGWFILPLCLEVNSGDAIKESTWLALDSFINTPRLNTLMLITHVPLLDDSVEDIIEKSTYRRLYRRKLGFYPHNLERLLSLLIQWEMSGGAIDRQVVLVSGHSRQSFHSVIQQLPSVATKSVLVQLVIGPMQSSIKTPQQLRLEDHLFPKGSLFDKYLYAHQFVREKRCDGTNSSSRPTSAASRPTSTASRPPSAATRPTTAVRPVSATSAVTANSIRPPNQLLHLQIRKQPAADDRESTLLSAYYVSTSSLQETQRIDLSALATEEQSTANLDEVHMIADPQLSDPNNAANLASCVPPSDCIPPPRIVEIRMATSGMETDSIMWTLPTSGRNPLWLQRVITQPVSTDQEAALMKSLQTLCQDKTVDMDAALVRYAPNVKSGVLSLHSRDRAALLKELQYAMVMFYEQLAGMTFRAQCPVIPTIYVINYSLEQQLHLPSKSSLQVTNVEDIAGTMEQNEIPTEYIGAMDSEKLIILMQQSFVNAVLFDRRLKEYYPPDFEQTN